MSFLIYIVVDDMNDYLVCKKFLGVKELGIRTGIAGLGARTICKKHIKHSIPTFIHMLHCNGVTW